MIYTLCICMCQIGVTCGHICAEIMFAQCMKLCVCVRNDVCWLYKVIIEQAETGVGLHVSKAQEFNKGFIAFNMRTGLRAFIRISFLSAAPHI